jgi:hypothetical protein
MAYDRYDTRRDRWRDERGNREDRGFFERAGDEIASWFGDDEAERRRREDERMNRDFDRDRNTDRGYGRDFDRDRSAYQGREWRSNEVSRGRPMSEREYRRNYAGYERDFSPRGYGVSGIHRGGTPSYVGGSGYTGGYGYGYGAGTSGGYGSSGYGYGSDQGHERWERDDYRNTSYAGSAIGDRHYHSWRQRQLDELDRDYDDYRRENQARFESDFGNWREKRQHKRGLLGQVREHMEVVGSDGQTLGKVDCVRGDHIVLTKSDSDDNRHHSIRCTMVDSVEGDQVRLDVPAEEAKSRWDEAQNRGFFGREDEETNLNRSFAGTYDNES